MGCNGSEVTPGLVYPLGSLHLSSSYIVTTGLCGGEGVDIGKEVTGKTFGERRSGAVRVWSKGF